MNGNRSVWLLLLLLTLPAVVQGQFTFTTNNGAITITGYTGSGGAVTIPDTTNGYSVTSIGDNVFGVGAFENCTSVSSVIIPNSVTSIGDDAFYGCSLTSVTRGTNVTTIGEDAFAGCGLTSVAIPDSVTSIGDTALSWCSNLTAITLGAFNPVYSSVSGVLFNQNQTTLIQYPGGKAGSYAVPDSVTSIGGAAFGDCHRLTSVIIPKSVTSIGDEAFWNCSSLTGVYFKGNAPTLPVSVWYVFGYDFSTTFYYLPGTTGWGDFFANSGLRAVLWNPQVQTSDASFGVLTNGFGFTITGSSNLVIVVEACTNLANPAWSPVMTNTLTGGSSDFTDPHWTNYTCRFYRLRSP
jgi:hypothetical protein